MGKRFDAIEASHAQFIAAQKIFFVATAPASGRVNLSPKGMDSLRVIDGRQVAWLNVTGSGNETAAHIAENGRMTIMFCAFEGKPMILRLYGTARVIHPRDAEWSAQFARFEAIPGARQIFLMDIEMVQTSCGMAVPFFDYREERTALREWAEKKGEEGVREYWLEKNRVSLDGRPTGIDES